MTALVQGDLRVSLLGHIAGWCMLPDQPAARATVEVLVDGQHNMLALASARANDPGDGRHGFYGRLPGPIEGPATRVIEAREVGTGAVFGRVVFFPNRIAQPIDSRLAALDCSPLRDAEISPADHLQPALIEGFHALAAELRSRSGAPWRYEAQSLARRAPLLRLSSAPSLSLILPTGSTLEATLDRLRQVQTACDTEHTEIFLMDDGADPRTVLLPEVIPGLRYGREMDRTSGAILNEIALAARGTLLCFIADIPPAGPWHWPWQDMNGVGGSVVHIGPALDPALLPFCPVWRPLVQVSKTHGIVLALPRVRFIEAGGFHPTLHGIAAYADMAQKCALLGVPTVSWRYQVEIARPQHSWAK